MYIEQKQGYLNFYTLREDLNEERIISMIYLNEIEQIYMIKLS